MQLMIKIKDEKLQYDINREAAKKLAQGEKQIKALEEHGKQPVKESDEKESLTHSKQKIIFEELANRKNEKIQNLSKQIYFNDLTYNYKGKTATKGFIAFKAPLDLYKTIKEGYLTLEKLEEKQKKIKSEIVSKRNSKRK